MLLIWHIKDHHEQEGKEQADYGTFIIDILSYDLKSKFGKVFSKRNLELIKKFYITCKIAKSLFSQSIGWSHYLTLMRILAEINNWFMNEKVLKCL